MASITVIIPNYNGIRYLDACLSSLRRQSEQDFEVLLVDNGSTDGSVDFVRKNFPEVRIGAFSRNTGFCHAVNQGIRRSESPYVLLLNNDTVCEPDMIGELKRAIGSDSSLFSCQAKLVRLSDPAVIDDAGDCYSALGWARARGKGKRADAPEFQREADIFASCAAAAIYRRDYLEETGLLDERHFAYLEDIDLGYRACLCGWRSRYIPTAVVRHAGSGTTGSSYNDFKVRHSSRNSVYLIWKNMPDWQILLNLPWLLLGFGIKSLYFARMGFGRQYVRGLMSGIAMCRKEDRFTEKGRKVPFKRYLKIQVLLWRGILEEAGVLF